VAGKGDPLSQSLKAQDTIETAWSKAGATMDNVLCTRVFTTDVECFDNIATAHAKYFSEIRRVSTGLVVSALAQPELFVGIEADALIE